MRAFLSSTFVDLVEHRKAAAEALQRLSGHVGRMEVFGARPEEPSAACLREVEQCDIFVGVYAHRYGFVLAGAGVSITEVELDYAIKFNKPIFCFLVNEDHPWPPKQVDPAPMKGKLDVLKQRINQGFVRDSFTTPDDLAFKIAAAIGRYLSEQYGSEPDSEDDGLVRSLRQYGDLAELLERVLRDIEDITRTDYNQIFLVAT